MSIDKTTSELPNLPLNKVREWKDKASAYLKKHPNSEDAVKLLGAVEAELSRRRVKNRIHVPPLWWEPRESNSPETHGYEAEDSAVPVASIFKSATHTAMRKAVYSVRVGDRELRGRFEKVGDARKAGSDAWQRGANA